MQSSSITVNKGAEGKENLPGNGSTGGPRTRSAAKKAAKVVTFASSVVTSSLQGYGNMMLPSGQGQTLSPPLVSLTVLHLPVSMHGAFFLPYLLYHL